MEKGDSAPLEYKKIVETEVIKSSQELKDLMYDDKFYGYIFRGQSRESYKLVPSLLRDVKVQSRADFYIKELRTIIKFYHLANRNGLNVPHVPSFYMHALNNKFNLNWILHEGEWSWLSDEIIELVTLAQHYGLKTRMLDWTTDIRTALYFACNDPADSKDNKVNNENMVIWCIRATDLMDYRDNQKREQIPTFNIYAKEDANGHDYSDRYALVSRMKDNSLPLRFWIPYYSKNINICAQQGILSMWQYNLAISPNFGIVNDISGTILDARSKIKTHIDLFLGKRISEDATSLDRLLFEYFDQTERTEEYYELLSIPIMRKIVISSELKDSCLKILRHDNYDKTTIFPGYESIAERINDEL